MSDNEYRHLVGKARDAKRGGRDAWGVMSTGEKVALATEQPRTERLLDRLQTGAASSEASRAH